MQTNKPTGVKRTLVYAVKATVAPAQTDMATTVTAPENLDASGGIDDKLTRIINQLNNMNTHTQEVHKDITFDLKLFRQAWEV
jgi:hypothetical protein